MDRNIRNVIQKTGSFAQKVRNVRGKLKEKLKRKARKIKRNKSR